MEWFVVDETNKNPTAGQFFIVGGLVFRSNQIEQVDAAVEAIRLEHGYRNGDSFKFQLSARPDHVSVEQATSAKKALIAKLVELDVRMIAYVLLHDIGIRKTEQERMRMALNTLSWAYHRLLERDDRLGVMVIDRDDHQHVHLTDLFQNGLRFGTRNPPLRDRIKFFGMTANNASHLSSAVDVALGGFRFAVNASSLDADDGAHLTARSIFEPLSNLLWGVQEGDVRRIGGYGFLARPREVRVRDYEARYAALRDKLQEYSNSEAEEVADPESQD